MSNLKQFGVGTFVYMAENKQFVPAARGSATDNFKRWFSSLEDVIDQAAVDAGDGTSIHHCPSVSTQSGLTHYQVQPRLFASTRRDDPARLGQKYALYNHDKLTRATENLMVFEGVENLYAGAFPYGRGASDEDAYNLHSSRMFWQGYVYDRNDANNGNPIVYNAAVHNAPALNAGAPSRGQIRFRHNRDSSGNGVFADGHAESFGVPGSGSGNEVLQRNVMIDK